MSDHDEMDRRAFLRAAGAMAAIAATGCTRAATVGSPGASAAATVGAGRLPLGFSTLGSPKWTWTQTLDRDERTRLIVQIIKLTNEELPYIPLYFNMEVVAHVGALQGPYRPAIESTPYENIHQWTWK